MSVVDELAQQRQRRQTRLLASPLIEDTELTLGDVVASVLAARDELPGDVDVVGFLTQRGHGWRTIEAVKTYLDEVDRGERVP